MGLGTIAYMGHVCVTPRTCHNKPPCTLNMAHGITTNGKDTSQQQSLAQKII